MFPLSPHNATKTHQANTNTTTYERCSGYAYNHIWAVFRIRTQPHMSGVQDTNTTTYGWWSGYKCLCTQVKTWAYRERTRCLRPRINWNWAGLKTRPQNHRTDPPSKRHNVRRIRIRVLLFCLVYGQGDLPTKIVAAIRVRYVQARCCIQVFWVAWTWCLLQGSPLCVSLAE